LVSIPSKLVAEQYQDIVVNNVVVSVGTRESATRYEAVKKQLQNYRRPFTILDLGAAQGYFSFRAAYDFPQACAVMVEGDYAHTHFDVPNQLEKICAQNNQLNNIIFLKKHITIDDLERLAQCEHFDVVLSLNFIHHFGAHWKRAADAIFNLGDYVIIETPPSCDKVFSKNTEIKQLEHYLEAKQGKTIAQTPRHTDPNALALMQIFETPKKNIEFKHWFYGNSSRAEDVIYQIESTFDKKHLFKVHGTHVRETNWLPGINLITFKALNGAWPNISQLVTSLIDFSNTDHRDLLPWNFIVQGHKLSAIDDDGEVITDPLCCLLQTIRLSVIQSRDKLEDFILNYIYPRQWINTCHRAKAVADPLVAEISLGELVDKITILEIKVHKTKDVTKLKNINYELATLTKTLNERISQSEKLAQLKKDLYQVNLLLWDIEDQLREKERNLIFDEEFITLARSVYITNDHRAQIKREINLAFGSHVIEEKIYQSYTPPISLVA
jgi:hypothetical protein